MANNNRCGCGSRRNSNNYGCLNSVGGRYRWDNYPYYPGPCPDVDGDYDDNDNDSNGSNDNGDRGDRRRRRRRRCGPRFGVFTAMLPIAVTANGIIPLANSACACRDGRFPVNSGLITIEEEGTYLATYTVRVPEGATLASTVTLNVNDASQSSAISEVGGTAPNSYTAQAIFEADRGDTVTLRSSEAVNITDTSVQPLFTLTLVRLDDMNER